MIALIWGIFMNDKSKYYIIIPAEIRYDSRLKANEKLIYGELVLLAQETGYCWATNSYFANLYGVSKVTVSKWLSNLETNGYIKLEYIYNGDMLTERRVYICDTNISKVQEKISKVKVQDRNDYTDQKDLSNTVETIVSHFNSVCGTKFKSNTSATRKLVKKHIKEGFTVDDFNRVIDLKFKDWGENPFKFANGQMSNEYLRPATLFGDKFESYVYEALTREASEGKRVKKRSPLRDLNRSLTADEIRQMMEYEGEDYEGYSDPYFVSDSVF